MLKNPLYLAVMVPLWFAARELVARDYNAVGVVLLYLKTAGRSVDSRTAGVALPSRHFLSASKTVAGNDRCWDSGYSERSAGKYLPYVGHIGPQAVLLETARAGNGAC
jgi:hypothetical protein